MQNITATVTKVIGEETEAIFNMYREELQKAYLKKEGVLAIPLSVKLKQGEALDDLEVEVSINFSPDKIKDSISRVVNEKQEQLPLGDIKKK
jgi:hypothetical protein